MFVLMLVVLICLCAGGPAVSGLSGVVFHWRLSVEVLACHRFLPHSDIRFIVGEERTTIYAHKSILATRLVGASPSCVYSGIGLE